MCRVALVITLEYFTLMNVKMKVISDYTKYSLISKSKDNYELKSKAMAGVHNKIELQR